MGRIETVMYKCDWCGLTSAAQPGPGGVEGPPDGWTVLDGAGCCEELCLECSAGIRKLVLIVKAARRAGLPFDQAVLSPSPAEDK